MKGSTTEELDIPVTVEGEIDDAFIDTLAQLLVDLDAAEDTAEAPGE